MSLRSKLRKCSCLAPPIERPVAPLTKLDLPGDTGPLTMPTVATTTGVTTETSVGTTDFPTAPVEDELLPVCYVPKTVPKPVEGGSPERERAVILIGTLWVNYTVIRYHLATSTTVPGVRVSDMQDAVRRAFKTWKDIGMGLEFVETKDMAEAEIRVSFEQGGSWSYVGTDNINGNVVRFPSPTMNFGWNISTTSGFDTALHETGHALGLNHEHQAGRNGIDWDRDAVIKYYSGAPNYWDLDTIEWNIFRQIPVKESTGSLYDKKSVMHYPLRPGLVKSPADVRANGVTRGGGLSKDDKLWVSLVYPPKLDKIEPRLPLRPFRSALLDMSSGEQRDYSLKVEATRSYRIGTYGFIDSTLALFEVDQGGTPRYVAGDDDSGENRNAMLVSIRLQSDRQYVLRVRMVYGTPNIASVMFF